MIRSALAGEWMKFWRNRPAAFWAFQFTPLLALGIGLSGEFLFRLHADRMSSLGAQSPLSQQAAAAFGQAASPLTQLFCLVGVATLFAAEHQWGTWRLLVTRQPRAAVMLAKICVYVAGCVLCTGGIGAAGILSAIASRVIDHRMDGLWNETWWIASARVVGAWIASVLELLVGGAVAAAAAILLRSTVATLLAPLLLGAAQLLITSRLSSDAAFHPTAAVLVGLPGQSARVLQLFIAGAHDMNGATIGAASALLATASLVGWAAAGFGAALWLFEKRDLARG
jgi:ABC-type transport system involved in multi-copper enzyme maturation permease subunit